MRKAASVALLVCAWLAVASAAQCQSFVRSWGRFGTAPGRFDFTGACGAAVAPDGKVFVTDTGNHRVQAFLPDSTFLYQWGSIGTGPGQFGNLSGIAADASGNMFVLDTHTGIEIQSRVQEFSEDGTFLSQWLTDSTFLEPPNYLSGIAVDLRGNVFVGDSRNGFVKKFSPTGKLLAKWGSKAAFLSPGPYQFWGIAGVALDELGYVYVADAAYWYVQTFTNDGQYVTTWGSEGPGGGGKFPSAGGPFAIGYDMSGHLYTTDYQQAQVFSTSGAFLNQWGSRGSALGQFYSPSGIAISRDGFVYVVDHGNNRIEVFTSPVTPTKQTTWGQLKASYR